MTKVTAIVPTFNEADCIEKCLNSLTWADEILIVDSFSTDTTVEIARRFTDKIVFRDYRNSADQKNWIIPQAANEWIFLLDADEYIEHEMVGEIGEVLKSPGYPAYWIRRTNYFMGKRIRFSGWQGDRVIRLFKRDLRYEQKNVHAEIVAKTAGRLKNPIFHNTYKNLEHYLAKIDRYTTWGAMDRAPEINRIGFFHLFIKPAFRFVQFYFIRLGFLDGWRGYVISCLASYTVFLRSLKILRLKRKSD